jgi:hypothetical protein
MTLGGIAECLVVICETDNEARDAAVGRLRELSANDSFPDLIMAFIVDAEVPLQIRELAIYVCQYFQTPIPAGAFPQLLACLDSDDVVLLNSLAGFISRQLDSDGDVTQVLALPPRYIHGQIRLLSRFLEIARPCDFMVPIVMMLLSVLASDVDTASKVLAANGLRLGLRQKVEDPDLESQIASFFLQDLTENSVPLLIALCPTLAMVASPQVQFELLFPHLQALSEMAPFPQSSDDHSPRKLALELINGLHDALFNQDDERVDCDPEALVRACCLTFVLSDDDVAAWESDIEDFVLDNICEEPEVSVRHSILSLLDAPELADAVVAAAKEMIAMSPRHQEAAFHLLSSLLPRSTECKFHLEEPEEPIAAGRYLVCLSRFGCDFDTGMIEYKLHEDGYISPILAAMAIIESKKFSQYSVLAAQKLLTFVELFETEVLADFLDLVAQLMAESPGDFAHLLPDLLSLCADNIPRKRVAVSAVEMISILGRCEELFETVLDASMPFIMEVLQLADSRDVGLDLLAALVTEHASLPIDPAVFDVFMHSIRIGGLDNTLLQPIFPLIAFFTRSGFGEPLLPLVIEMLGDASIKSSWFHYFASVVVAFAANGTDEATVALLQAVVTRPDRESFHVAMCLIVAISALLIVDKERTLAILEAARFTLQMIVGEVDALFDKIPHYDTERRFIVAGLFQLPDATFQIDETQWTTTEFAFSHLVQYAMHIRAQADFEELGIDRTDQMLTDATCAFERSDPLYLQNPITRQSFSEMVGTLLAGVEVPEEYTNSITELVALLTPA